MTTAERELDVLVALLEEHGVLWSGDQPAWEQWYLRHKGIPTR